MNITKDKLITLWYEDADGNKYVPTQEEINQGSDPPSGFDYMHTQFPLSLRHSVLLLNREDGRVISSSDLGAGRTTYSEDLVLALVGDWTLSDAILIAAQACEKCMNVLAFERGLSWGYAADSEDAARCNTSCLFCS